MNEKGKHYLEQNVVLYPQFKDFPNQVFVTSGNGENVNSKLMVLLEEDNMKVTDERFYSNQNVELNNLNQRSKTFQRKKNEKVEF